MNIIMNILIGIIAVIGGGSLGYFFLHKTNTFNIEKRKERAEKELEEAKEEAFKTREDAKKKVEHEKERFEENMKMSQRMTDQMEKSLKNKEAALAVREEKVKKIKASIEGIDAERVSKQKKLETMEIEHTDQLATKAGKAKDVARAEVINRYEKELKEENQERLAREEEYLKENAQRRAKKIIVNAIQRMCSPTSVEPRSVNIEVPRDIIKGKIVGKDAQNILYLEEKLDVVDIVFNDLPKTISISSFNLMARRVAQKTIEKLIKTKAEINPRTIDKAHNDAKEEMQEELYKIGKDALEKMGIRKLPTEDKEFVRIVGRLKFRTSYSQNIMLHSMEVGYFAIALGAELGVDVETCRIGGFLHDLGKAIDQDPDVQGSHDFLTKELMEKYGFSDAQVHAAWTHHESEKPTTPEAIIVQAADALSASRPGARAESLEKYLERLYALESTASSFDGVRKAFAISAGREVRVVVDPVEVSDERTQELAEAIAKKVESDLAYPGKIRVNVIRKTKTTEIAR